MGKLIDFFSRKHATSQDFTELVGTHGRYVGCLPKQRATQLKGIMEELDRRKGQIDAMIEQWNDLYEGYAEIMSDALTLLQADPEMIDTEGDEFYIDENNHCWLVKRDRELEK